MSDNLSLIICGFTGRMGQAIAKLGLTDNQINVVAACASKTNEHLGKDIGELLNREPIGVVLQNSLENAIVAAQKRPLQLPVIIDFSDSSLTSEHAQTAASYQIPLVVGTTALKSPEHQALQAASEETPVLVAPNTSLGANILLALSKQVARWLADSDVEISETHHKNKKDNPSGTALMLGKGIAAALNQDFEKHAVLNRNQQNPRKPGDIDITGTREGERKGEHTVSFYCENETLTLKHDVTNSNVFAKGALKAAWYLVKQEPGLYDMSSVLEIKTS